MMELNDNEFDAAFRRKVFDADPQYEDAAWDKMEQKLKKRERLIFVRNATGVAVLLVAVLIGIYGIVGDNGKSLNKLAVGRSAKKTVAGEAVLKRPSNVSIEADRLVSRTRRTNKKVVALLQEEAPQVVQVDEVVTENREATGPWTEEEATSAVKQKQEVSTVEAPASEEQKKRRRVIPFSLSISAGPEFNSSSVVVGGDPGFTAGLAVELGIAKRMGLQTGIKYSLKGYHASNYAYKFNNERVQGLISEVDASCAVLEIPLLVSYKVAEGIKGSVDLNAGISSYFMLKEDYNFKYTPESGIPDRLLQRTNKNKHYFSVVDLSATYFTKLKKAGLQLGFQPFVKIPLTGVGEGKVKLNSSGIALRLRYDIK